MTRPSPLFSRDSRLLREKGSLLLVPDLAEAIAGAPTRGSRWAHPNGKQIFNVANELEDSDEVVTAKLIDGKVTFVHARLWPALLRVVTDPGWRRSRTSKLDADAKKLLTRVERSKEPVTIGPELAKARKK